MQVQAVHPGPTSVSEEANLRKKLACLGNEGDHHAGATDPTRSGIAPRARASL